MLQIVRSKSGLCNTQGLLLILTKRALIWQQEDQMFRM
uniref:Uncharacterized protein n=1 Tax=Arundo donax TaxID=35708 RepID=A0A0A9FXG9_ARUDO